ncbi:competence type IV pilus minor pilin ComGG [Litchfieldia alkalitelluris]|uniref:competence type IV pilus minor pilin ComGG n=1 Tax=Litchfieldia alkalitelluris TaxID=304268 RepID=UPI0009985975|nr:competence type IV pilus minor pilin ComGG [Litchfieldia alkalitelluris]
MRNEKGHILPGTIVISLLLLLILTHEINNYHLENKFTIETDELFQLENLVMLSVKEAIDKGSPNLSYTDTFTYPTGNSAISVSPQSISSSLIIITTTTKGGGVYSAQFTYDFNLEKISNWIQLR